MKYLGIAIAVVLLVVAFLRARRQLVASSGPTHLPRDQGEEEVLRLVLVPQPAPANGAKRFELRWHDESGDSRFVLELAAQDEEDEAEESDESPFSMANGALRRCAGSKPGPLVAALAKLHDVPPPPLDEAGRVDALPIDVGVLATAASVNPRDWNIAGRYSTKRPGSWLVTKLFLPNPLFDEADEESEETCELFLALDEAGGAAEFSVKDSDYGPAACAALARIL